ncbi:DUF2306 domain-containing protein [Catalinimonas niigatensis]|uniref:DUF2306 domain-containing protein n=1 Tax=Catalinimonas niigatensis TaxID=1397264 RepID=UPI0026660560|nr:DUF2306 domain-containing protein [Catalinimonas niigatensis]WPP48161.1 DUF2306 domain-containing protein [Catalinimonas niigatensis]
MELIRDISLFMHVVAGFMALVVGIPAFASRKGGRIHRLSGKIYVIAMLVVAFSSFLLALIRFNPFLFMVGVFTLYMTVTGYRGLYRKQKNQSKKLEWVLIIFLFLMAGYMLIKTFSLLDKSYQGFMPIVIVFTVILSVFIVKDILIYLGKVEMNANKWLLYHIGRVSGAYIATFTAFLVTNLQTRPAYIAWLLPTLIGTFVIAYFQRKYKVKRKRVSFASEEL